MFELTVPDLNSCIGIIANFVFPYTCSFLLYLEHMMLVNMKLDINDCKRITFQGCRLGLMSIGLATQKKPVMDNNLISLRNLLLPPANEVWGKVIFSQACVKNSVHRGDACSRVGAVPAPGGVPGLGGGACSQGGACSRGGACSLGSCLALGVPALEGVPGRDPPGTATAVGGTHPTGMHSC